MAGSQSEHIVTSYEEELTNLASTISEMGGMVEAAIAASVDALLRLDHDKAREIVKGDKLIDEVQTRIDETAVSMIARRQPMAQDLRRIVSTIHVATDLERIGDMAKSISRRTLEVSSQRLSSQLYAGVKHMSELVLAQIARSIDAVTGLDEVAAVQVCENDDEIDAIYMSLFREFLTYMMEDPRNITDCTHLLFCAKNLERAGDHATNIAEAAYYIKTGRSLPGEMEARES